MVKIMPAHIQCCPYEQHPKDEVIRLLLPTSVLPLAYQHVKKSRYDDSVLVFDMAALCGFKHARQYFFLDELTNGQYPWSDINVILALLSGFTQGCALVCCNPMWDHEGLCEVVECPRGVLLDVVEYFFGLYSELCSESDLRYEVQPYLRALVNLIEGDAPEYGCE
jgi:hypothetical protein